MDDNKEINAGLAYHGGIVPYNHMILIEAFEPGEKISAGGIVIPETVSEKKAKTRGKVIGWAQNCNEDIRKSLKKGMFVFFNKFVGTELKLESSEAGQRDRLFLLVKDTDILAEFILVKKKEEL